MRLCNRAHGDGMQSVVRLGWLNVTPESSAELKWCGLVACPIIHYPRMHWDRNSSAVTCGQIALSIACSWAPQVLGLRPRKVSCWL